MVKPPASAMISAVPNARPVSQAWAAKSGSAMIAESRRAVSSGEVNTSCPMISVATCHTISIPVISSTVSASADQPRDRACSAAGTAGSISTAPGIEPLLPNPQLHVDAAHDQEQQQHKAIHRLIVERVVGEGDGVTQSGARHYELARDHTDEGIDDGKLCAGEKPGRRTGSRHRLRLQLVRQ